MGFRSHSCLKIWERTAVRLFTIFLILGIFAWWTFRVVSLPPTLRNLWNEDQAIAEASTPPAKEENWRVDLTKLPAPPEEHAPEVSALLLRLQRLPPIPYALRTALQRNASTPEGQPFPPWSGEEKQALRGSLAIFYEAFKKGAQLYLATFSDPYAIDAIKLTLTVAAISVPLNLVFGLAAAWAITKFTFRGKSLLVTVLDLPFAVSPVIAGLVFVLIFSTTHGWFAEPLKAWDLRIIFALPGIAIATIFITLPFIARELIPVMQAQGRDEELAALTLGAGGWRTFFHVTLPNVKWGLFYGVVLCNARAMGEFGAVAVVSGNIKGKTSTMPLYIETLYMEYQTVSAFSLATVLSILALVTLLLKNFIEWRSAKAARH